MPTDAPPDFPAARPFVAPSLIDQWNLFDKAASKDIKWWFFALLMIGMAAFAWLYHDMRSERESLRVEVNAVRDSQLAYVTNKNDALMSALLNNTRALESNTQTLNRIENRKDHNE